MSDEQQSAGAKQRRRHPRLRWLQFRLRTALWLLLIVALALAWWRDREQLSDRLERSELLREAARMAQPTPENLYWRNTSLAMRLWIGQGAETTVDPLPQFEAAWRGGDPTWSNIGTAVPATPEKEKPPSDEQQQAVQQLVLSLRTGDAETRARAACTLGMIGPPAAAAAPDLRQALHDDDRTVRWHAVFALGRLGPDPASAAALRDIMRDDGAGMPAYAAVWLRRIDPQADVVPRLLELLGHPQADTRRRAVSELAAIDSAAARAGWRRLIPLLADPDTEVRRETISAVAKLAPRDDALDALSVAFKIEADNDLKRHAAMLLVELDAKP